MRAGRTLRPFRARLKTGELCKDGRKIRLQDQPFQILLLLLKQPGEVVSRDALRQRLWPDNTFVDFDQGLNNAIRRLRDALRDSADDPAYIETLPRLGYRFIASVEWMPGTPQPAPTLPPAAAAPVDLLPATPARHRMPVRLLAAAGAVGAIALAAFAWNGIDRAPARVSGRVMLAVLPFQSLGAGSEDYLTDGLTEEMISQLGTLAPDRLGVIARTSAMQYKNAGKSAADIGRELGVAYLLEGSVRRSGDRVRITARLVEVADQTPRWSQVCESDLLDVLTTQKEVARAVVDEMRVQLSPERIARTSLRRTADPLAFELYLRGRHAWNQRTAAGLREAVTDFERAIARDRCSSTPTPASRTRTA